MDKNDDTLYDIYEELFVEENPRSFKKQRKSLAKKDRSKYKKTDQKKKKSLLQTELPQGEQGRIISIQPSNFQVLTEDDHLITCTLKGALKLEKTRQKNLLAIGDLVHIERESDEQGIITTILERESILSRRSHGQKSRQEHIIAANVDQVLITTSVHEPALKPALIDRYIIQARKGNLTPIVLINKIDLIESASERKMLKELAALYESLDVTCILVSAENKKGLKKLKKVMENVTSVFSGQSGVGKSSLINAITSSNLRVGEIIERIQKGAHTTTKASLIPLKPSGFCIDTPGIRSFGMWELSLQDIGNYFRDFHPYYLDCKYPNCTHRHEPNCKVKEAVETKLISSYRYQSYMTLMEEVENGTHYAS